MDIYTIGHSTHTRNEFVDILRAQGITHVADIRSTPYSRRYPWFSRDDAHGAEPMRVWLQHAGIDYNHHAGLGGHRTVHEVAHIDPALTAGWTHKSFRNYAAWTFTSQFGLALRILRWDTALETEAHGGRLAYMCSEAVPWRCHRSILSTILTAQGDVVHHIMDDDPAHNTIHEMGQWGAAPRIDDLGRVVFPAPADVEYGAVQLMLPAA